MAEDSAIAAVGLKLPTFWPEHAAVGFVQSESPFVTRGIVADSTKYHYITAALDQETATRVLDLLLAPPANNKYQAIKERLLATFSLTESQRAARLLSLPGLGDARPSQLLDKMLALLGDHEPCFLFREIFLQQLPVDIRAHLVHSKVTDCRLLATAADALWHSDRANVNAVRARGSDNGGALTVKLGDKSDFCFYHHRWGSKARRCEPPCRFLAAGNDQAGRQ